MKRTILILILIIYPGNILTVLSQNDNSRKALLKSIEYSNPDLLPAHGLNAPGFPDRNEDLDVLPGFKNPPPGYGEVPFWWWSGDPLNKERLLWQIEELHKKGITGMQINYIHKDSPGWPTYPAEPEIFSDEWWKMWEFASEEAGKRSMGIGMSGYTIDWPDSKNLFNTIIYSIKEIQGQELLVDTVIKVRKGNSFSMDLPDNYLEVWAYNTIDGKLIPGGKSLSDLIKNNKILWRADENDREVWIYAVKRHPGTLNPIHPFSGKTVIDKFFQQFEDHSANKSSEGLNYFFQDELKFGVGDLVWSDDFREIFRKQKGYDVFETLPGMFTDIGRLTSKSRLDYMDVKVQLSEERYFKPIFEWHWKRGKIYGCDPEGRGKEPGSYGDNFRANRWYTAPGHDTPSGKADLIKGKVSSSIAALYKRPRVWLEGYHSLGWGATPEHILFASNENYLYGCNLLNLHGLYYSTHGSYWEWAPPCYHFRMPYWDHLPVFLKYFERLSYLLSQGTLKADIAIIYPVSTAQARMNATKASASAFESGTNLFNNGYDFIFMDDQSIIRSEILGGKLSVSDMEFKVLILPDLKAVRWTTITRALEFFHNGGIVIATGSLPEASDHAGTHDPDLDAIVSELFGTSASGMKTGQKPALQRDKSGGAGIFLESQDNIAEVVGHFVSKHASSDSQVRFMHRKVGLKDVFMVMGAPKNSRVNFLAEGKAEWWDPWTGNILPLTELTDTVDGIMIEMPLDSTEAQIIVFTPENAKTIKSESAVPDNLRMSANKSSVILDGKWEFELKPTMDNRWGDFRLPVTEKLIGAEARIFRYAEERSDSKGWELPYFDDSEWDRVLYSFGQKFWKLGPLPDSINEAKLELELSRLKTVDPKIPIVIAGKSYTWTPYSFSWRYGVEGDPGHQGYHGLKEEITSEFICLGKPAAGLNETIYKKEKEGSLYYLWTSAYSENVTNVTISSGGLYPAKIYINGRENDTASPVISLNKGFNPMLIKYTGPGRGHFVLLNSNETSSVRTPLSMEWWDKKGLLPFDIRPSENRPAGWYRFTSPPGLKSMIIRSGGKVKVFIDGRLQSGKVVDYAGARAFFVELNEVKSAKSVVAMRVEQTRGDYGGSAFPEPVLINCKEGITDTGDWSKGSVLENYSGGAWYRKNFLLSDEQSGRNVTIDLGKVVATAEIHINGSLAGILVTSPWKIDISEFVKRGENRIEILVYNTLANHYLTIPTKYRGSSLQSGLIGPVSLEFSVGSVYTDLVNQNFPQ